MNCGAIIESFPDRSGMVPIRLRLNDMLYFLHIPKTGGTTLFSALSSRFAPAEILSYRGRSEARLMGMPQSRLSGVRLMRGHADFRLCLALPRPPVVVTILREPLARSISYLKHIQRHPQDRPPQVRQGLPVAEPEGLLRSNVFDGPLRNRQARQIAGTLHGQLSPKATLEVAKTRLAGFASFGLQDRYADSIRLLNHTFGWNLPLEQERLNRAPTATSADEIPTGIRNTLIEMNEIDYELFAFAQSLFDERIRSLPGREGTC